MDKKKMLLSELYMDYKNSDISKGLTEEEIRRNVEKIYSKTNSYIASNTSPAKDKIRFSVNDFLDNSLARMSRSTYGRRYNSKVINQIMEVPYHHRDELLRISSYFYIRVQEYKQILEYKSNMLPYSYVVQMTNPDNFDEDSYMKNLQFVKDYSIANKLTKITKTLLRDDVYFGYELSDESGKSYLWKTLPSDYCEIIGRDRFETYRVSFDMKYFDRFPADLNTFPQEFRTKYNRYKERGKSSKMELDSNKAFAFKFDETVDYVLPFFSGMFLDLIRLSEIKDVDIISAISDNYKLIHQQVPLNKESQQEDDFLISGGYLAEFHNNLRANVPEGIGVATTPMPVTGITLKSNVGSAEENIVNKHVSNLMTQSGTSSILFNGGASSSLGLNKNIQVDENTLFKLLRQYELFMNKRLFIKNKSTHKFTIKFLDHTYYNTEDLHARYLKGNQYGMMQVFELASVSGMQQIDFINNLKVVDKLGIMDMMKPLMSSHVQGGANDPAKKEIGDEKKESDLTEEGARSRERDL